MNEEITTIDKIVEDIKKQDLIWELLNVQWIEDARGSRNLINFFGEGWKLSFKLLDDGVEKVGEVNVVQPLEIMHQLISMHEVY